MKRTCRFLIPALLALYSAGFAIAQEIPLLAWVHDPLISSVAVSPDGHSLVALTLSDINEYADVTVWDTRDLSKPPKRFRPPKVKALGVNWVNNDLLYVVGRTAHDYQVDTGMIKWFQDKAYLVDTEGKRFKQILKNVDSVGTNLFNRLPDQPGKILVSVRNLQFAEDIYEVDLKTNLKKPVQRGATGESYDSDVFGNIRGRTRIVGGGEDIRVEFSYVHPETGDWEAHHDLYAIERVGMQPAGYDVDGRTVFMLDNKDRDKALIRKYDLITREVSEPIFADPAIQATGVLQSRRPGELGKLIGFSGLSHDIETLYADPDWRDIQSRIYSALPRDARHSISSYSDDFTVMVITSTGPKRPAEYYLLINGEQLISLGSSYPHLKPELMADVNYVTYEARDGLEIPGYLTLPTTGEMPFPTVVMPHGGPWARDVPRFDYWVQFLANRGYAVLQPQFRGSEGWGQKLWRAGDKEWGQKMQYDNDDGAKYLVDRGIADPDRLAIYGYSYGGYAAMAAVVSPETPFKCAIAGASGEIRSFDRRTFENGFGRQFQNPSVGGLDILSNLDKAHIPVHIFHGERDQNVPIWISEAYVKGLRKNDKEYEYTEILDMWHSLPWWPQHHLAVLEILEGFLAEGCGFNETQVAAQ